MNENLFERFCSFGNLHDAYLKAKRCKGYKKYVLRFNRDLEANLLQIQRDLLCGAYRHGAYTEFIVNDSKKRQIKAAPFRDRVVHHAVCSMIEPIFDSGFIHDSYACRKGKGTHKAVKRLKKFLKSAHQKFNGSELYCLKCDISRYFASIDHAILLEMIGRKIKDERLFSVIGKIIGSSYDSLEYENLLTVRKKGIPIGNLTSQLFANIYLNDMDRFMKHRLQMELEYPMISPGAYYIRYMDDFLFFHNDMRILRKAKSIIRDFLSEKLDLSLHPKKANIFPVKKGVEFLGYRISSSGFTKLRKSTVKRFVKRTKRYEHEGMQADKIRASIMSFYGFAMHGNSFKLMEKLWETHLSDHFCDRRSDDRAYCKFPEK